MNGASSLPAGLDESEVFRSLFSAYPDALLVADAAGTIVLANTVAEALLGYAPGGLLGLGVEMLVPDAIRPRHAAYREAYGRSPRARPMGTQMELVAKRRDGSEVMVEIALSPLQSRGLPLVVAAIRDIGAYPRVKQALQRARYSEHLAQLGRLAVDTLDPQVLYHLVPATAAEALQVAQAVVYLLEPNGVECRVAGGVGLPEGLAVGSRVAASALEAASAYGQRVPLTDRGRSIGALTVQAHEARQYGEDELRFLESLANLLITSLQRAQSEEALNHAQALESVGQLTGGIAHDFNNLLTVIQGNLQVLEELPALAQDVHAQQLVGAAVRASKRGAALTGKLLAFARRQVLQPTAVDVNALLGSLADMLRRTLDQHIRIEVDAPPCPPCLADPGQLESALLNIAINARDAMPEGGRLRFRAVPCAVPPDAVRDEFDTPPGAGAPACVALSVSDSGTGMTDEVKERAFEPFFTTKEAGRGTGLGLSTVYGFVKQSRGAITIESTPGAGTTVTLYIPSVSTPTEAADAPERGGALPPGLRVLMVEDDAEVRAVIHHFLDALGCEVTACASGEQALQVLAAGTAHTLLLTDIALGAGMRGTQLAAQAQALHPSLHVLLMSGYSAELLEADRDSPPGWELLPKPCTREELAQAITRVLGAA